MAKVALRFGCAKQSKNLKRYLLYIVAAITLLLCSKCCRNYLRAETIYERKLLAKILYSIVQSNNFPHEIYENRSLCRVHRSLIDCFQVNLSLMFRVQSLICYGVQNTKGVAFSKELNDAYAI